MDKLHEHLEHLRHKIEPAWSEGRAEDVLRNLRQRQLQKRFRGQVLSGSMALSGVAMAALWLVTTPSSGTTINESKATADRAATTAQVVMASQRGEGTLTLADGSAVRTSADSELSVLENAAKRVALSLPKGSARFNVVPDKTRYFAVRAGAVEVTVLGTVFEVAHVAEGVQLSVERGRVQVTADLRTHFVSAGESAVFFADGTRSRPMQPGEAMGAEESEPEAALEADAATPSAPQSTRTATNEQARRSAPSRGPRPRELAWRSLAKAGDYEAAYQGLRRAKAQLSHSDPAALLDAADAARFSGHPDEAVRYLRQVTSGHRQSPMAPLAAFTLGRVCLDQLGQPHRAAEAFAMAYDLSPNGSLAQDALARQVEALSKGGREREAFEQAERYMRLYPRGRRVRAVRLYGGLD